MIPAVVTPQSQSVVWALELYLESTLSSEQQEIRLLLEMEEGRRCSHMAYSQESQECPNSALTVTPVAWEEQQRMERGVRVPLLRAKAVPKQVGLEHAVDLGRVPTFNRPFCPCTCCLLIAHVIPIYPFSFPTELLCRWAYQYSQLERNCVFHLSFRSEQPMRCKKLLGGVS